MILTEQRVNYENIFICELLFKIDSPFSEIIKSARLLCQIDLPEEKVQNIVKIIQNNSYELLQIAETALFNHKANSILFNEEQELIDSIHHEIRNPMNGIIGFAEILNHKKLQFKDRVSHIFILVNCINQLETIINSMWNYSMLLESQTK
ncbi:MAG: hypothetical protein HC831_10550 [Chloroflexia bacterium]|nr:hypothetical protein [Chloroflexia bacterium]